MRNLKRALSLTLASVMLLGMMVVGSSALSFNDADKISNVTAASVLEELKVMQGDGRGNFMPEQPVSRAQMAIIICRILYGEKLNVSQFAGTSQYTDVAVNDYYTGHINLATQLGIINGYGDGRFGPDDTVTTAQAALMLCRALGYFQGNEMTGNWGTDALAAITKATNLGMFGDLQLSANALLSRDNVAEMTFNTITRAVPVDYNERFEAYYTAGAAWTDGVTLLTDKEVGDKDEVSYRLTLGSKNFDLYKEATAQYDDMGRPGYMWMAGKDEIVVDVDEPVLRYVEGFDTDEWNSLQRSGYADTSAVIRINGVVQTAGPASIAAIAQREYKGTVVELYSDPDNSKSITNVVIYQPYLAKVLDKTSKKITLEIYNPWLGTPGGGVDTLDIDNDEKKDDDWYDKLAKYVKDDYLLVYNEVAVADRALVAVADVDTVTATVTTTKVVGKTVSGPTDYKPGLNGDITVGSTKYTLASGFQTKEATPTDALKAGSEYTLYLDENGYVIGARATKDEANVEDYLFVTEGAKPGFDVIAKAVFSDGSKQTITVSKVGEDDATWNDDGTSGNVKNNTFYTFEKKSNGNYELKTIDKDSDSDSDGVYWSATSSNPAGIQDKVNPIYTQTTSGTDPDVVVDTNATKTPVGPSANSNTVFIAKDKVSVGVKNAPNVAPTIKGDGTGASVVYYVVKDGRLLLVYTGNTGSSSVDGDSLVYVLSTNARKGTDDGAYYIYDVVRSGEKTTLTTRKSDLTVGLWKITGMSGEYAELSSTVTDVVKVDNSTGVKYSGGTLTASSNDYILTSDAIIRTVDHSDGDAVSTISADSIESQWNSGFKNLILVKVSSTNDDVMMLLMIKPAS